MAWAAIAAGVISVGTAAYSSSQSKKQQKKLMDSAKGKSIGSDITSYVDGYSEALPSVLNFEGKYRKKFQGLNLGEVQSFLGGTKGQQGLAALQDWMTKKSGKQLGAARDADLSQMTGDAGATRGLLQALDPQGAAMVNQAQQQAAFAQQNAQGLTAQESRSAQQFAREGAADRGRTFDNTGIAAEVLNRDSILGQKRQEASAATQNAFNLSNQFYQPGLQALTRIPNSYTAGQGLLGIGLSSIGSSRPQLIDPDMGVNLGAANRQNQFGAASAAAQISAQNTATIAGTSASAFDSWLKYRDTKPKT